MCEGQWVILRVRTFDPEILCAGGCMFLPLQASTSQNYKSNNSEQKTWEFWSPGPRCRRLFGLFLLCVHRKKSPDGPIKKNADTISAPAPGKFCETTSLLAPITERIPSLVEFERKAQCKWHRCGHHTLRNLDLLGVGGR